MAGVAFSKLDEALMEPWRRFLRMMAERQPCGLVVYDQFGLCVYDGVGVPPIEISDNSVIWKWVSDRDFTPSKILLRFPEEGVEAEVPCISHPVIPGDEIVMQLLGVGGSGDFFWQPIDETKG